MANQRSSAALNKIGAQRDLLVGDFASASARRGVLTNCKRSPPALIKIVLQRRAPTAFVLLQTMLARGFVLTTASNKACGDIVLRPQRQCRNECSPMRN